MLCLFEGDMEKQLLVTENGYVLRYMLRILDRSYFGISRIISSLLLYSFIPDHLPFVPGYYCICKIIQDCWLF